MIIQGGPALKHYHILCDKRHVITKDSNSNVAIYDVLQVEETIDILGSDERLSRYLQARMTENLGKCDYDEEIRKRTRTIFVPNWFSVDLKVGVSPASVVQSTGYSNHGLDSDDHTGRK